MKLEFKKSISNKIIYTLGVLFIFLFLLGYFLPIGIDKVKSLSYSQFFFSSYTVATQLGFLLFSFVIAYFINKEYSNKNIFGIVAPFEASNTMYRAVEKILNNESTFICPTEIINTVSFFVLLFIVNTIVLLLSRKRWLKIGM